MKHAKLKKGLALSFVYLMLVLIYLPIFILIVYSFTESRTIGNWTGFSFQLYKDMFNDPEILGAMGNSLIIAVVSSLLATFIGAFSAVGIYHLRKAPKLYMDTVSQVTLVNADIVTGIAFMLFFLTVRFIPDGFATLIIAHTMICIPYVIMSVTPRLSQLNPNLYEAGLDLGASPLRTLFKVILPQLIPGMVGGFALAFTLSLDDFVITKFNNGDVSTISTYLYNKIKVKGVQPELRAMSTIIFLAILLILILINVYNKVKKNKALKGGLL